MNYRIHYKFLLLAALLIASTSEPLWAHFRFGVVIGPGIGFSGPYYGPYYANPDPYYGNPDPYDNYSSRRNEARRGLAFIEGQLSRAREQVEFYYDDGDISKDQRDAALRNLKDIRNEVRATAKANGGFITGAEENEFLNQIRGGPRRAYPSRAASAAEAPSPDLGVIDDRLSQIRSTLNQKLADGKISKIQHDGTVDYLAKTEQQARTQAIANGGTLTPDQQDAIEEQLKRVEYSIK